MYLSDPYKKLVPKNSFLTLAPESGDYKGFSKQEEGIYKPYMNLGPRDFLSRVHLV